MSGTAVFRQEGSFMPLKLKAVMAQHHVTGVALCSEVLQMNGTRLSEPALNLLLNWGKWPAKTPQDSIRRQIETALAKREVPEAQIATIWDLDLSEDVPHGNSFKLKPDQIAARSVRLHELERLEAEMLSKEAKVHFEVGTSPFVDDVNSESDVFTTKEIRAAFNALYYTAKHAGITALVCESGGGKTVLRRWLDNTIRERQEPIRLLAPQAFDKRTLTAGQICEAIIRDLNPDEKIPTSLERRARKLRDMLEASKAAGNSNALVIEEAHDLSTVMFKHLKRFWEMEKGFTKLLGIILIGQPELKEKLDARRNFEAREFINRCEVYELSPLGADLEAYLEFKLKRVGAPMGRVFAKDACDAIRTRLSHPSTGGRTTSLLYPLYVNNLVTKAMNLCAQLGVPKVNGDVIAKL
jgi:type II secretory pathway predicted ATPase ExeA